MRFFSSIERVAVHSTYSRNEYGFSPNLMQDDLSSTLDTAKKEE